MTIADYVDAWAAEQGLDDDVNLQRLMFLIRNTYLTGFIEGVMVGDKGDPLPSPDHVWAMFEQRDLSDVRAPEPAIVVPPKPKLVI